MIDLETNTWVAIVSAIFAGLSGAAAVGAVVAQYRLLPRPLWVDLSTPVRKRNGSITWKIWISNRGNAAAHDVRFVWRNNTSGVEEEDRREAVVPYGEDFRLDIHRLDDESFEHLAKNKTWSIVVFWRQAPRLRKIRSSVFYMKAPVREPGRQINQFRKPRLKRVRKPGA